MLSFTKTINTNAKREAFGAGDNLNPTEHISGQSAALLSQSETNGGSPLSS